MGVVDDSLFELKLAIDRALRMMMGRQEKEKKGKTRYCPACGTPNPGGASRCVKCMRSFTLYNPDKK